MLATQQVYSTVVGDCFSVFSVWVDILEKMKFANLRTNNIYIFFCLRIFILFYFIFFVSYL